MKESLKKDFPKLYEYLMAYGLNDNFVEHIDRIKFSRETAYTVVGALIDGRVEMIDLSATEDRCHLPGYGWNMLNDGMQSITEADWRKLKLAPYCETFTIPGHESYGDE